ncbi:MAG: AsmA family protein [Betaproteobacteria bacterium]|nr:AsmA family protein [Betaproteobacteria bacterium]
MKWLKRIGIILGVIVLILAVIPFFITLNDYIPRIEKEASAKLKEQVTIKSIRFAALPLPHITVEGITVGTTDDIKVGKVTVTPDLFSLLQSTKVIKSIEIDSLLLTQKATDKIPVWTEPDAAKPPQQPQEPSQVRVESIRLDGAVVRLDNKANFGPFDARVSLNSKGEPGDATITTQDGKLKAFIKPGQSNYLIDASAKSWKLPIGPAIVFDELIVKGVATLHGADFSQVSAKLYGGTVSGKANLGWQKGLQLKGSFDVDQVELKQLVPLLSPGTNISGKLTAKPVFSAASATQLLNTLRVETPFNVQNGVLHGVDILQAATSMIKQGATGGETRFDQLSGHLNMERGAYRFTQLKIASGVLAADGNMNISPKQKLSGRVNAQVKALGTSANVPLNVAGTVGSPLLYPTGAGVAGAAVGTVILGPGLGTSMGAKVGTWAEGLFGKKDEKKR